MAQNGAPPELPDAVNKPPEGVVLPPKDIRAIIEKTAGYVARNGAVFEDRIRQKEQSNSKFSFLTSNDAYEPFYQWRLLEVRAGRGTAVSAGRPGESAPGPEKPKGPEAPPEFQFSARMPNISALDLEVVKLTALHVARKGKSWMTTLSQREARNFQFDFLRPQHSLYNFFQRLVDQYSLLLQTGQEGQKAEQARIQALQANLQDRFRVLERAKTRAAYNKFQESQRQQKEEAEEAEKIAYAQIDWHDFVVVETVVFTEADDEQELPRPQTLNDLQSASLEQKAMISLARPDMRIEEAMPTDDMSAYAYDDPYAQHQHNYNQQYQQQPPPQQMPPQYAPSPVPSYPQQPMAPAQPAFVPQPQMPVASPSPQPPSSTSTPQPQPNVSGPPPMRIKTSYVPRAAQRLQQTQSGSSICPNCGLSIPNADLDQHLKIELLDPRWKEQQSKAAARFSTTNLGGTDVAANLKQLRARADGAGASASAVEQAAARVLEAQESEDEQRRKKMRLDENGSGMNVGGIGTTGGPGPGPGRGLDGKGMTVEEQIRSLQNRYGGQS